MKPATDLALWIGGFTAGEACFTRSGDRRFAFEVALGASDRGSCALLREFFGVGHVFAYERREPHHEDTVVYAVGSLRDLVEVIVPFMDEHLLPSYKRLQYLEWRTQLLDYWETRARRRPGERRR